MSGSRLGRGRGGRLAVYGGCGVVVVFLILLYRAATSEMARLQELHIQCAHQQEALAAQLQVIFEYKVRLEKSLAEEKSANAATKQELQQRASRVRKDSVEAMQRYNSLQQTYKLLQTEHQDLQEDCKKREKIALDDKNRLESTLQDLRGRIKQAQEDKKKELEHLKNKHLELEDEKTDLETHYKELLKTSGNSDSTIDHLRKEVIQLKRELEEAKRYQGRATSSNPSLVNPQSSQQADSPRISEKSAGSAINPAIRSSPPQQQQVSRPSDVIEIQPLHAPRKHHAVGDDISDEETLPNEPPSDVGFAEKNDIIVPVNPNDPKDGKDDPKDVKDDQSRNALPLPYKIRDEQREGDQRNNDDLENVAEKKDDVAEEQLKHVILPPNNNDRRGLDEERRSSSKMPDKDDAKNNEMKNDSLAKPQVSTEKSFVEQEEEEEDLLTKPVEETANR